MHYTRRHLFRRTAAIAAVVATARAQALDKALQETGLKDLYKDDFYVGTAIGSHLMARSDPQYLNLVSREFNALTLENAMKWLLVQPEEGRWEWTLPDRFMDFGEANNMYMVGHVLMWHSQVPGWVFNGHKNRKASTRVVRKRMQDHITTLAGRYKGRIHAWDVVNEAVDEGKGWRKSPWFKALGPRFVEDAFNLAHEVDNRAHLLYNDYNMHNPDKRAFVVDFIKRFKKRGVPIHGIGMQGHIGLDFPDTREFEASIEAFAAEGMRVHITELDLDVLPVAWKYMGAEISTEFAYSDELNPYPDGLPEAIQKQLTDRYVEYFKLFLKHRDKIDRVTFWGTSDAESWKNNFPVRGRTNYPLLFDRNYQPKPAYFGIKSLKS